MDAKLLDVLVCPLCKAPVKYDREKRELICRADRLAYPVRDGIPLMLPEQARETEAFPEEKKSPFLEKNG